MKIDIENIYKILDSYLTGTLTKGMINEIKNEIAKEGRKESLENLSEPFDIEKIGF